MFLQAVLPLFLFAKNLASAASWSLTESIKADGFFDKFDWFTDKDPTNGLVTYQSLANAQSANLSYVNNGQFFMHVDTVEQVIDARRSVRISSKTSYADGVYILNLTHVPIGCAVWPAFWTVTENLDDWPIGGEIDILENANDEWAGARVSLHTKDNCTIPPRIYDQSGMVAYTNCSAYTPENTGCTVEMNGTSTPSWGTKFNQQGGGIFAMERSFGSTGNGVRVWYWKHGDHPQDLSCENKAVDPSSWGKPGAHLNVADFCYDDFADHKITFDITLCGDMAGNRYNTSGCNQTFPSCPLQVAFNGSSFNQSYWAINDLRIFGTGGGDDNAANSKKKHTQISTSSSYSASLGMLKTRRAPHRQIV